MAKSGKPKHDIARTLRRLLPVRGALKDLEQIRDQLRLLNEIRDPSDERLCRVIIGYLREPRFCREGTRYLKVDAHLSDEDLSARWTCVRIGPTVSAPTAVAGGNPPKPELISRRLPAISAACANSRDTTFFLWDLLKKYFSVTRDNSRFYHDWLNALSEALQTDSRFVIVAVDEETGIPVEWMLATDREREIEKAVALRLPELVSWMQQAEDLVHLTRDLVHRFFSPRVVDDTYDIHGYYRAVSNRLADTSSVISVSVREGTRQIEGWCLCARVQQVIRKRLGLILKWLHSVGEPQTVKPICRRFFPSLSQLASIDVVMDHASRVLSEDLRFLFDRTSDGWRVVPSGPRDNLPAYQILWECRRALSANELREKIHSRFSVEHPTLDLHEDDRFRLWSDGTWGLSKWIDIGDWAYEYLHQTKTALSAATILSAACDELDLSPNDAVFNPEDDERFARRPNGRWYCRHVLSNSELDEMLTAMSETEGGLTLKDLVVRVTGFEARDTDALARLAQDERFVEVEGRWFAKSTMLHPLTDGDMDQLLNRLRAKQTGVRLTTLVEQVLRLEAHLTDAQERMRADSRFREIMPGVWVAADLEPPSEERSSIFNRPIRSAEVSVVPEDDYTEVEELTERASQAGAEREPIQVHQITRTLSLLDVQHGNLVLNRAMAALIPQDCQETIHFTDELGDEFTVWIDGDEDLLQGFGQWFKARELTFGDKVRMRRTAGAGFLEIEPTGQHDERVYEEALQRQDVENLIQDARKAGKSYHDLMIEVMKSLNQAAGKQVRLHREDIYDLLNHKRTASRSYVFSLLSLTDCPYEELRYFVPHGDGYWSFDPARRKAFEMKMKQLVEEVEGLQAEKERLEQDLVSAQAVEEERTTALERLKAQAREQKTRIAELSAEDEKLVDTNERLKKENESLLQRVDALDARVSAMEEQAAKQGEELEDVRAERDSLAKELTGVQDERDYLRDSHNIKVQEIEQLRQEGVTLEQGYAALGGKIEQLALENAAMQERVGDLQDQVETLKGEKATARGELDQARAALENLAKESRISQERVQEALDRERQREEELRGQIQALERRIAVQAEGSAQLTARLDRARADLNTPLGKGFVALLRALGGPDLSNL